MVGSDNPSPMLMVFLTSAGVLNLPTLGLTWLVLLAHSCPSVPHCPQQGPVSPFHQTQEHQPKNTSWCQPRGRRGFEGLVG